MKHCLIVDDSNSIRKVASRIIGDLSFRTSEAESSAEATDVCRSDMPDCILVDWQMPDGDSIDLVSSLRRLPGGDKPTILYLLSDNDPKQIAKATRGGASGYMLKPFDGEGIARTLVQNGLI